MTLVVYSGLHNPYWQIVPSDEILSRLLQARRNGYVYPHICIPPKSGYKGLLVQETYAAEVELIVGPETVQLQLLLFDTMPSSLLPSSYFRQRIRSVIESGFVTEECPASVRRKRYAPPYNPARWNRRESTRRCNNCYNYANTLITNTYVQPGVGSGQPFGAVTAQEVQAAAVRDGLQVLNPHPGANDPVPGPPAGEDHLVALFVATGQ